MEEIGIGRPSTYASIQQVLQDRNYVRLEKRRFHPEDRGRIVTAFLSSFFERYVKYNFTADLETQLDLISDGRKDWKLVLHQFWKDFHKSVEDTKGLRISEVIDALDADLGPHFFPPDPERPDYNPRSCPACGDGRLGLKLGKTGGFVGCSNYPDCRFTRALAVPVEGEDGAAALLAGPLELGVDPNTGLTVSLRKGPYGHYVQLGEAGEDGEKPKRSSVPRGLALDAVTLEIAIGLLGLPREVGAHPESGKMITAGIGRFGPYLRHDGAFCSLKGDDDVLTTGLNRAVILLAEALTRKRGPAGKSLGMHPDDDKPVTLHKGRYGPYVKHGRINATLPDDLTPETVTLEDAIALLAVQAEKRKGKKKTSTAKRASKPKAASGKAKAPRKRKATSTKAKTASKRKTTSGKSGAKKASASTSAAG